MNAIVLTDVNMGIAKNGKQICYIPEDLQRFRNLTLGRTVLFGRKTFESFPGRKPLPERKNICLSTTLKTDENLTVISSIDEIKDMEYDDIFVVEGESIYKQLYRYMSTVYMTVVMRDYEADQFFPAINRDTNFYLSDVFDLFYSDESRCYYTYKIYKKRQ